jgi:hypothetical protein
VEESRESIKKPWKTRTTDVENSLPFGCLHGWFGFIKFSKSQEKALDERDLANLEAFNQLFSSTFQ